VDGYEMAALFGIGIFFFGVGTGGDCGGADSDAGGWIKQVV
jgi:hypothetical protein